MAALPGSTQKCPQLPQQHHVPANDRRAIAILRQQQTGARSWQRSAFLLRDLALNAPDMYVTAIACRTLVGSAGWMAQLSPLRLACLLEMFSAALTAHLRADGPNS